MSAAAVAQRYGTPAYVYDLAEARRAHAALAAALPAASRILYSLKANPHPDVAGELAHCGCDAEVSSAGEVVAALAAGFEPARMLMTGPGKSRHDIATAVACGVRRFSVESAADLARIGHLAAEHGVAADVLLRVNPDATPTGMGLTMGGAPSQFGIDAAALPAICRRAPSGARIRGLHLFGGTNVGDPTALRTLLLGSLSLAARLAATLPVDLRELDLGGGFPAPFARAGARATNAGLPERLDGALDRELPGWRSGRPLVSFESGRYLAGSCGTLVCRVVDVKRSRGRTFVVLDGGINQLGGMAGLRRVPPIVPALVPAEPRAGSMDDCVVCGPLCTPLDVWSSGVRLPSLERGDMVEVPNAGAYGLTASLIAFLGRSPALEIAVDGDDVVSVTRLALERTTARAAALSEV